MAKVVPAADSSTFVNTLEQSSIVSPEALAKAREAAEGQADAKTIARELLKEGELTRWQAGQLLHGYSSLVVGKYELLDQIGSGELGRVYLAEHVAMNRRVAMKVLSRRHTQLPNVLKRFLADAERASVLDHRNLVHVYDVNQDGERYFLVMEYVEGQDLQKLVEKSGPLAASKALDYLRQVAEGLQHAHEKQVYHGDLKPTNVLVDPQGLVKVLDIGVGKLAAPSSDESAEEAPDAATLAGRMYRAPEQQAAGVELSPLADIFSLGSTLYFLLSGKSPTGTTIASDAVLQAAPKTSTEVAELCEKLTAADPAERPQTMDEVLGLIEAATKAAAPPKAKPDSSPGEKAVPPKAKKPPVAKSLDDETVVVATASADTSDSSSFGDFNITTTRKAKPAVKAAAKKAAAKAPPPEVEEADAEEVPAKVSKKKKGKKGAGSKLPLILAASIGGGVLALSLIVGLLLFLFSGSEEPVVAKAEKAASVPVAEALSNAADAESNPVESNPESNPVETNPVEQNPVAETNPTPPAEANPTPPPTAVASATSSAAKPAESKPDSSAPPAEAKPTEPPAAAPAKPAEPAKPDAKKVEPKKAAPTKPAPAKPAPAKPAAPKKVNPMAGFAKAVSLPPLPAAMGEPTPEMLAPKELGPCKVSPELLVALYLKGGETVVKGGRQKFTLTPANNGTALQDWEVSLGNANSSVLIAKLGVKDQKLMFQWLPEAAQENASGLLSNCALDLSAGEGHHVFGLREVQVGEPLTMDFDKTPAPVKWSIDNLPDPEQVAIQVTKVEGLAKKKFDPDPLMEGNGDEMTVWTGPGDDVMILGLKLKTALSARGITISGTSQYKLHGMPKPQPYIKNKFQQVAQGITQTAAAVNQQLARIQSDKKITKEDKPKHVARVEQLAGGSAEDFGKAQAQAGQLIDVATAATGNARVHFRVYYLADDVEVDLLKTDAAEEPAAEAKDAKK